MIVSCFVQITSRIGHRELTVEHLQTVRSKLSLATCRRVHNGEKREYLTTRDSEQATLSM